MIIKNIKSYARWSSRDVVNKHSIPRSQFDSCSLVALPSGILSDRVL